MNKVPYTDRGVTIFLRRNVRTIDVYLKENSMKPMLSIPYSDGTDASLGRIIGDPEMAFSLSIVTSSLVGR